MIFTILITIVFIAELIIGFTLLVNLLKIDCKINKLNQDLLLIQPSLEEICGLIKAISFQIKEMADEYRDEVLKRREEMSVRLISKLLAGILLWKINLKLIRKIRKSKITKTLAKGLTLLQIMV